MSAVVKLEDDVPATTEADAGAVAPEAGAVASEASDDAPKIESSRKLIIQPMLQHDAGNFTVLEGLRLRALLVKFFSEGFDIQIEASGMTRGQVLDLYLAEEGTPKEVARLVSGEDSSDKDIEGLKRLKYLATMAREGTWGDQIMLIAFSEVFKQPVHVYQVQADTRMNMFFNRRPKLFKITSFGDSYDGEPMPVLYHGSHYSALLPKVDAMVGSDSGVAGGPAGDPEIVLNKDLFLLNVPGDGNCLFTSLRLAMEIKNTRKQLEARPDLFDPAVFKRLVGKTVSTS